MNAEKLDEFTENALTQLLESSHVIRCFLVDALGIDFAAEGDRIRIFRVFRKQQQGRRTRTPDLSSSFQERSLEGGSETNGAGETKQCIPQVTLDPVTERLTTLMRQKMGREQSLD